MLLVAQNKPDGPYKIISAHYGPDTSLDETMSKTNIIKIFKDGYWIGAFFGNPQKPFEGSGGGIFKTRNNKYIETLQFYSWDSTAVGRTYTFNYKLYGNTYTQEGVINSDKYKDFSIRENYEKIASSVPLKNAYLEGAWRLEDAVWGNEKLTNEKYAHMNEIKIYAYPRFAWAQYNNVTKQFMGAGGGTYQFDGKKLTENIEYITYDRPLNKPYELNIEKIAGDKFLQIDNKGNKETWKHLK